MTTDAQRIEIKRAIDRRVKAYCEEVGIDAPPLPLQAIFEAVQPYLVVIPTGIQPAHDEANIRNELDFLIEQNLKMGFTKKRNKEKLIEVIMEAFEIKARPYE